MCPDEPQRCVFVLTEAQSARAVRVCLLGSPLFLCVLSPLSLIRGLLDIITLLPCLLKKNKCVHAVSCGSRLQFTARAAPCHAGGAGVTHKSIFLLPAGQQPLFQYHTDLKNKFGI